jgi:ferritin-like metal-binding protein YciE
MLNGQAKRLESYPELRQRISLHLDETKEQANRVAECLRELGSDTSVAKDAAAKAVTWTAGLAGMFAGDEVIKGAMAGFTFENFEISAYTALIATAEACGESHVAEVCRDILHEEQEMAAWLAQHLPETTRQYLAREEMGVQAKR